MRCHSKKSIVLQKKPAAFRISAMNQVSEADGVFTVSQITALIKELVEVVPRRYNRRRNLKLPSECIRTHLFHAQGF